ncbi:MAG: tetratricopeptide repeat protein, partial [Saprospiraceae bacterium]
IGLFKKEQSDLGRANALQTLGDLESRLDEPAQAELFYQQALLLYQKELEPTGLINTCLQMARLTHAFGPQGVEQASAQTWHERSLQYARQTGVQYFIDFVENAGQELFNN